MGFKKEQVVEKTDYKEKIEYVPYTNELITKVELDNWYQDCFEGVLIETLEQLREICSSKKNSIVAVDTETTGLTYKKDKIVGISFSFSSRDGYYVPLRHQYGNLPIKETIDIIAEMLYNNKILMFNALFDGMMLEQEGIDFSKVDIFEVQSLIFCADSNVKGRNLKWASEFYLGRKSPTFKHTLGTSDENFHFGYLLPYESVFYASSDSLNTFGLYEKLFPVLDKECGFILKLDNELVKVMLNYYIKQKIYIDKEKMIVLSESIRNRILELERKIFKKLGTTVDLECVSYDGFVEEKTFGKLTMDQLQDKFYSLTDPLFVKTPLGYNQVLNFIDVGLKELIEVELENGKLLHVSPDHYFLIKNLNHEYLFKKVIDIDIEKEELIEDIFQVPKESLNIALLELSLKNLLLL